MKENYDLITTNITKQSIIFQAIFICYSIQKIISLIKFTKVYFKYWSWNVSLQSHHKILIENYKEIKVAKYS